MRLFILFIALFIYQSAFPNKVDDLKTDQDVADFIISLSPSIQKDQKFKQFTVQPTEDMRKALACDGISETWAVNSWEKVDINQDGLSDIVVISYWYNYEVYVVVDNGDNTFKLIRLSQNIFDDCEFAKPTIIDKKPVLLFYQRKHKHKGIAASAIKEYGQIDTLIYKYGGFIERNVKPSSNEMDSLEFEAPGNCGLFCPNFKLTITANGNAGYNADAHNLIQDQFHGQIQQKELIQLKQLMAYINIESLKDNYEAPWSDDYTVVVRIRFKDGSVKKIKDYGEIGTFGLSRLYSMLLELRNSQGWATSAAR